MSLDVQGIVAWLILIGGGAIVLYLLWGLVKASIKMLFYLVLILLVIALLKQYNLLPPEMNEWLEPQKIIDRVHDRIHGRDSWKTPVIPQDSEATSGEKEELEPSFDLPKSAD